jgi:hypothetical protein
MKIPKLTTLHYALIFGGIVLVIITWNLSRLFKKGPPEIDWTKLPNAGSGIPEGWNPATWADRVYNGVKGWNWAFSFSDIGPLYQDLYELDTDDMLAAVYMAYNQMYGLPKWNETMYKSLEDESTTSLKAEKYKPLLLGRMVNLNLI